MAALWRLQKYQSLRTILNEIHERPWIILAQPNNHRRLVRSLSLSIHRNER